MLPSRKSFNNWTGRWHQHHWWKTKQLMICWWHYWRNNRSQREAGPAGPRKSKVWTPNKPIKDNVDEKPPGQERLHPDWFWKDWRSQWLHLPEPRNYNGTHQQLSHQQKAEWRSYSTISEVITTINDPTLQAHLFNTTTQPALLYERHGL